MAANVLFSTDKVAVNFSGPLSNSKHNKKSKTGSITITQSESKFVLLITLACAPSMEPMTVTVKPIPFYSIFHDR